MNKFLTFISLFIAFSVSAQDLSKITKARINPVMDNFEPINYAEATSATETPDFKSLAPHMLGSAMNFYGSYVNSVDQLIYSPEVNALVFVHRAAAGTVSPDESGEIGIDISTDGGANWTNNVHISPNMVHSNAEGRYPSVGIYAPTTNLADARFVESGPSHSFYGASGSPWGKTHNISGSISATPNASDVYGSYISTNGIDGTGGAFTVVKATGATWYMTPNYIAQGDAGNTKHFHFIKGTYNAGDYTWADEYTLSPDIEVVSGNDFTYGFTMASHPTQDKAYFILNTKLTSDVNEAASPHVYETTDGGTTWNLLSYLDYTPFMTALEEYLIPHTDGQPIKPVAAGVKATVDANGKIHMMCKMLPGSNDFGYYIGTVGGKTWFWDTEDLVVKQLFHYYDIIFDPSDSSWEMVYIAPVLAQVETASWGAIELRQHPQISRTPDGFGIFCVWDDTNTRPDSLHKAPNLFACALNSNGDKSEVVNLTAGTGAAGINFLPQFSSIVIDNAGTYELPVVISYEIDPDATGTPDEGTDNFMYLSGIGLPTIPTVGVTKVHKPDILIFPNPTADIVKVSVGAKVELYNILGAKLLTVEGRSDVTTINMAKYPTGTYLLKVYTDKGIITKKLQKN